MGSSRNLFASCATGCPFVAWGRLFASKNSSALGLETIQLWPIRGHQIRQCHSGLARRDTCCLGAASQSIGGDQFVAACLGAGSASWIRAGRRLIAPNQALGGNLLNNIGPARADNNCPERGQPSNSWLASLSAPPGRIEPRGEGEIHINWWRRPQIRLQTRRPVVARAQLVRHSNFDFNQLGRPPSPKARRLELKVQWFETKKGHSNGQRVVCWPVWRATRRLHLPILINLTTHLHFKRRPKVIYAPPSGRVALFGRRPN